MDASSRPNVTIAGAADGRPLGRPPRINVPMALRGHIAVPSA